LRFIDSTFRTLIEHYGQELASIEHHIGKHLITIRQYDRGDHVHGDDGIFDMVDQVGLFLLHRL